VRRFASDEKLYRTAPTSVPFTMNWVHDPQSLPREAGTHRFIWDLHSALPQGIPRSHYLPAGPWVVPGEYTVKLTVNGKSSTQPLIVKPDPRSKATQEALQRQFALASQLIEMLGEVSTALQQSSDVSKQIAERKKDAAGNSEILTALEQLNQKTEVASTPGSDEDFMLFGLALPKEGHEPLPKVAAALTGLLIVLESADGAPSSDVAFAAESWDTASKESLARWKKIVAEERLHVNSLLQKANLKPLAVE